MFGCTEGPTGIDCPNQLAYELLFDEWVAYNRQVAIWEGLPAQQDYVEPSPEDIYGVPDSYGPYGDLYVDEPADPYGFDEGAYP